ncbi:MAG TPA: amidophosphoribosyltransferase [Gaiellaceae bacterium]
MCGIVGVCSPSGDAVALAYPALVTLQHRGEESWGVAATTAGGVTGVRSLGLAASPADGLPAGRAEIAVAHTRYSTTGAPLVENSQPLVADPSRTLAVAHNGNITNADELVRDLTAEGYRLTSTTDSETILGLLACAGTDDPVAAVAHAADRIEGAYSVVALFGRSLLAFRDPAGFRPLFLGQTGDAMIVASETCALDVLDCVDQREVEPGELLVLEPGREPESFPVVEPGPRHFCAFEYVYLARRDSRLGGRRVELVREQLGEELAREAPADADVVVSVPASGTPAARGYARAAGLPFVDALVRNDYIGRTFIEPEPSLRELSLRIKFNVADGVRGERVVVVDDSIVRGSTMREVVRRLRAAGASELHLRIAAPPLVSPCYYGVDIADPSELVAAQHDPAELAAYFGADSLEYLSLDGLRRTLTGGTKRGICVACLTGRYPLAPEAPLDKLRLALARGDANAAA